MAMAHQDVVRLLNRVAFGATPADLDSWVGQPYEDLVDHLLDVPTDTSSRKLNPNGAAHTLDGTEYVFTNGPAVHWLEQMRTTPYPLEERVTFFWHDHFATSGAGRNPDFTDVVVQVNTLRRHGLGNFRDLVAAVTVDPAMLMWLDGDTNTKDKPNENYARELFELFTVGKYPQIYTEEDVREAARVLTGWELYYPLTSYRRAARFNAAKHDTGAKTVLGTTITNAGDREYLDLIDLALSQDVAPKFVAYKLVRAFAYTPDTIDLMGSPDPLVDEVAATLRSTDWDLKAALRTMMLSPRFRATDRTRGQQLVRPPVDLAVHAAKLFDLPFSEFIFGVDQYLGDMGQIPLEPPTVFGWPDSEHWLTTTTSVARYLLGYATATNQRDVPRVGSIGSTLPASGDLDAWTRRLSLPELTSNTEVAVRDYLLSVATLSESSKQDGVLMLLLASPEWEVV